MAYKISLFNHKGGVSKTTTAFNLSWMIATMGSRVVLVDADPQCNLTGMVLGYRGDSLEEFYRKHPEKNIKDALAPAFESRPRPIEPVECVPVRGCDGLFLIPGHLRLAEYEVTLGIAQELSGSIQTLHNLPGAISHLINITAEQVGADYVVIDMNPSLGSINQNLLMTSDFFIVPTNPDYFSLMAIDSLMNFLPKWRSWAEKAASLPVLRQAEYPFPAVVPKFLGTVMQKYRPRGGSPARAFQEWIDRINEAVCNGLAATLRREGMLLDSHAYEEAGLESYCLAQIPDFNSLIAISQQTQTPVFALTEKEIPQTGTVLETTLRSRDHFRQMFSNLADKVLKLIKYQERAG